MFVLGHTGLTLGAAMAADAAYTRLRFRHARTLFTLMHQIDVRMLLIGSMLPDIIDKPLGIYILRSEFSNGHIIAHTLLFPLVALAMAFFLYRWKRWTAGFAIAFGVATHIVFDRLWQEPITLFWPLRGWQFPRIYLAPNWAKSAIHQMLTSRYDYVSEIMGGLVLLFTLIWIVRKKWLMATVKTGRLPNK